MAHKQIDNLILVLSGNITASQLTATVTGDVSNIDSYKPLYAYINAEKIEVTAVGGQTLTIVRAVGNTIATPHTFGDEIRFNAVEEHVNELIEEKVDKESGKGLSSNDFTNLDKGNLTTAYNHSQSAHAPADANNYVHPPSHPISMISNLQTSLDAKLNRNVLTTKGDIFVHNGTAIVRVPKGADGQVLVADSNETSGLKWSTPNVYGTEFEKDMYEPATSFSTQDTEWQLFKEFSTQQKPVGEYEINAFLVGSGRNTSNDMRVRLVVDGTQLGKEFRIEPKDGGNDQRNWVFRPYFLNFGTLATHTIRIEVCSSNGNYSADAHESIMSIKRVA